MVSHKDWSSSPQAISSSSSESEDDVGTTSSITRPLVSSVTQQDNHHVSRARPTSSRLFAPFRSLGIISAGRPFFLIPHQSSTTAMVAVPIGERFQMLQCEHLQPVLVSQAVPPMRAPSEISHMISDASLSISVVGHGPRDGTGGGRGGGSSQSPKRLQQPRWDMSVTLFARTKPIQSIPVITKPAMPTRWKMVDMLHLGHVKIPMTGEKQGKMENALLVAVVIAQRYDDDNDNTNEEEDNNDGVLVIGNDDDDEETDNDDDECNLKSTKSISTGDRSTDNSLGQVVIYLATRTSIREQKRITLSAFPYFLPQVAIHPATYVNKILLGGSNATTGQPELILLNIRSGNVIYRFTDAFPKGQKCRVTAMEQSPAVDTVAVGTSSGLVHLINLRHDKLLFTLLHKPHDKKHRKSVRITSLSFRTDGSAMRYGIAPLAVARSDGDISIWDLTPPEGKDDGPASTIMGRTLLCEMMHVHPGGVSKIAFLPQEPVMVSTGVTSNSILMHIFDSPDHSGRILRQRKGHTAPPKRIRYLHAGAGAGGGILVNAADGTDASACQILSSGGMDRSLRVFSSARSVLDKEYSQGRGLEKQAKKFGLDTTTELLLPPIVEMSLCESRSRDWGDLVTIHRDHAIAYVWSTRRGAQSGPLLHQPKWNISSMKTPPPVSAHATSVAISACGNYAVIGTKGGIIYKYNIQSGIPRGCYPPSISQDGEKKRKSLVPGDIGHALKTLEKQMKISNRAADADRRDREDQHKMVVAHRVQAKLDRASHVGSTVTGLAVDAVNKFLISVGADAKLILWHFTSNTPFQKSPFLLPAPASKLSHIRDSDLAAIALNDFTALLFDCTSHTVVRRFGFSATGPITDLGFSPDGRSLFVSSLDCTVRVWDVPTNSCIDWMKFDSPVTSLTLSPTGEFLSTTHAGKLGIYLWSDKSFYQTTQVGAISPSEPTLMDEPLPIAEAGINANHENLEDVEHIMSSSNESKMNSIDDDQATEVLAQAKEPGLITMSGLPPAHWKNLFHLDLVKERNKPKEPPQKPPSAPFFLQWRSGENLLGERMSPTGLPGRSNANSTTLSSANRNGNDGEWEAVWSDDDDIGNNTMEITQGEPSNLDKSCSPSEKATLDGPRKEKMHEGDEIRNHHKSKRRKVQHCRSHLAALLEECNNAPHQNKSSSQFQVVTDHMGTLGPSAIDIALLTLCNGIHDLEEGLPLLNMAAKWLCESCRTNERFDAVNAYLHRFLHLQSQVITAIMDEETEQALSDQSSDTREQQRQQLRQSIAMLRKFQHGASDRLCTKMQHTLCLLRHFSRMV